MRASRSMKWFAIPKIALSDRQCVPYLGEKQPIRLKTYRPICIGCCGAGIRVGAEANRSPAKGLRRSLEFSPRLFRRRSSRSKVVSWIPQDSGRTHGGNHRCIRCTTPRLQREDRPAGSYLRWYFRLSGYLEMQPLDKSWLDRISAVGPNGCVP